MLHSITLLCVTIIPCTPIVSRYVELTNVALFYIVLWHVVSYHVPLITILPYTPILLSQNILIRYIYNT